MFGDGFTGDPAFDIKICSAEDKRLTTTAGYVIEIEHGLELLETAQIVIMPSWRNPDERPPQRLLDALIAVNQRGGRIVGLCLGAYVLAEAGLLDGGRATTHWAYAEDFSQRFPAVQLDAAVLYIAERNLLTSAGTAAGIDCCLQMLREQLGAESANAIARRLVVPPHRQGGQAQFIEQPLPTSKRDSNLSGLIDWIRSNIQSLHALDSLAARSNMSRRSFTRHFRLLTGTTLGVLSENSDRSERGSF
ncbi:MAG: DJ-1/PfpI family protein [Motiliproteus sp.]